MQTRNSQITLNGRETPRRASIRWFSLSGICVVAGGLIELVQRLLH